METANKTILKVEITIHAPIEKVWDRWISPDHIMRWNNASDDWHTPYAENDLRVGGKFVSRMAAKDGSSSFDFNGIYSEVKLHELISYTIEGGRTVEVHFSDKDGSITVIENFEAENINSNELQVAGWQAILNNFKKYVEG